MFAICFIGYYEKDLHYSMACFPNSIREQNISSRVFVLKRSILIRTILKINYSGEADDKKKNTKCRFSSYLIVFNIKKKNLIYSVEKLNEISPNIKTLPTFFPLLKQIVASYAFIEIETLKYMCALLNTDSCYLQVP